ncbi:MAG: radical SAM family heme chaperone HemW [Candidatus Eisenbacteria bacterium]|nr:radical SAM family heme chaperone HemW [Candidatus Eisenbacteria bacterium]
MDSLTSVAALPQPVDAPPYGPGIYVHVPFCRNLCSYCDFYVVIGRPEARASFVSDLQREMALVVRDARFREVRFQTLFFGGGTPSLLSGEEFAAVVADLRAHFDLDPQAEISVEANPDSLDAEKLAAYRTAGVTRVSVGVQSTRQDELVRMERPHGPDDVRRAFEAMRAAGIPGTALDLIYGLPDSDSERFGETLRTALSFGPDHVSAYLLTLPEKSKLARALRAGDGTLPTDENAAEQYELLCRELPAAGLRQYEISNFARPGFESRHNQNYWVGGDYLGLGPAAHSHQAGRRWANPRSLHRWRQAVTGDTLAWCEEERIDQAGRAAEMIFLGLRRVLGIDLGELEPQLDEDARRRLRARIEQLEREGLLLCAEGRLRLTPRAYLLSNWVMSELLLELDG